ncbi:MAG: class II fructose-bisphosphate aldolase [Anaerolineales bacterium]
MSHLPALARVAAPLGDAIQLSEGPVVILRSLEDLRDRIEAVVRIGATAPEPDHSLAHWLIRELARQAGAVPASIHDLYLARGRGESRDDFTAPAMNLRALPFFAARAVFRAARARNAGALLFEIARSEIGYTDQRPAEYAAAVLGAAVAEGYQGPVFLQGDHFQVSAKKFAEDPEAEVEAVRSLTREAMEAGFFNIDIDTSTLVDLSLPTTEEQQQVNYRLCAELTKQIRGWEPEGVNVSVGGEIGEVGGRNSTEAELKAFMEGYNAAHLELSASEPGLSKISVQTGTSHGGVVLPDGTIARVQVDFDTLARLSRLARERFGLAGAVQHGASTLPEEAFRRFVDARACEVHLATNFQNIFFDRLPAGLRSEMYAHAGTHFASERKPGQTDEQFFYQARKRTLGPFKRAAWEMEASARAEIEAAWETRFNLLFDRLNIEGTRTEVDRFVHPVSVRPVFAETLRSAGVTEDVTDLAD